MVSTLTSCNSQCQHDAEKNKLFLKSHTFRSWKSNSPGKLVIDFTVMEKSREMEKCCKVPGSTQRQFRTFGHA